MRYILVPVLAFAILILSLFISTATQGRSTRAGAANPPAGQGTVRQPLQPLVRNDLPPIAGPLRVHPLNPRYFTNRISEGS